MHTPNYTHANYMDPAFNISLTHNEFIITYKFEHSNISYFPYKFSLCQVQISEQTDLPIYRSVDSTINVK